MCSRDRLLQRLRLFLRAAPTMTGTGVDGNRYGTPDVLQQPQFWSCLSRVTDVDMNRDSIPDVVQQPQIGIAPHGFAASAQ